MIAPEKAIDEMSEVEAGHFVANILAQQLGENDPSVTIFEHT